MRFITGCVTAGVLLVGWANFAIGLTLDDAVARVRDEVDGRVLKATPGTGPGGSQVFLVRVISDDGRMYTLQVDAETGDMKEVATGPRVLPRGVPPMIDEDAVDATPKEDQDPCAS